VHVKLSKEDALVRSKWRQLIRGTEEDSDDSEGLLCLIVSSTTTSSPSLKGHKTPFVVMHDLIQFSTV